MAEKSSAVKTATQLGNRELVITRVFDAPRERVWKAWTDPEQVKRWWGPKIFTSPAAQIDLRVGGKYLFCMRSPEGQDFWSTGVYREIVPFERLVCTDSFADEHGNVVPATHYGFPADFPLELLVTVTLEEHQGKTKMTIRHAGFPAGEHGDMAEAGWNEQVDKLVQLLGEGKAADMKKNGRTQIIAEPGKQEIVITRVLRSPRARVFQAFTDPKLIPLWWGPGRYATTVDQMEVRPGGRWRFVQRDTDGSVFAFHGVYHSIESPEQIVYTFEFEGIPGHVLLETVTFEERDGQTLMRDQSVFQSVEDRDGMLQSGMEGGAIETMDRFEQLLGKMS